MSEILVRGEVRRRVGPTEGTITVHVRAEHGRSLETAIDEGGRRCAAVDAVIEAQRGEVVRNVRTTAMRTGKEHEHTPKGRQLIGYSANRTTTVACAPDGPALTALVDSLSRLDGVTLSGPHWQVAPDAEEMRQVRADAAADARRRAEDYARGLGQEVGQVLWLSEPGLRIAGGSGGGAPRPDMAVAGAPPAPGMMRSLRGGGGPEEEEDHMPVTIVVEPLQVQVTVEAAFSLLGS